MGETTYTVIRFRRDGDNEVIGTGWTLEQVQAHCNDSSTRGKGWFDGYVEEEEGES